MRHELLNGEVIVIAEPTFHEVGLYQRALELHLQDAGIEALELLIRGIRNLDESAPIVRIIRDMQARHGAARVIPFPQP